LVLFWLFQQQSDDSSHTLCLPFSLLLQSRVFFPLD